MIEPLTITRIDCPELPERERWRVARGEHTVATFATEAEAERHRAACDQVRPTCRCCARAFSIYAFEQGAVDGDLCRQCAGCGTECCQPASGEVSP